jgi:putative ABC transport system permease protein
VLRRTQWIEAALPLALGCALAIGLGLLAGATYLSLDSSRLPLPWSGSLGLAALAAVGAVLVGGLTVLASSPRISPDLIRHE